MRLAGRHRRGLCPRDGPPDLIEREESWRAQHARLRAQLAAVARPPRRAVEAEASTPAPRPARPLSPTRLLRLQVALEQRYQRPVSFSPARRVVPFERAGSNAVHRVAVPYSGSPLAYLAWVVG